MKYEQNALVNPSKSPVSHHKREGHSKMVEYCTSYIPYLIALGSSDQVFIEEPEIT